MQFLVNSLVHQVSLCAWDVHKGSVCGVPVIYTHSMAKVTQFKCCGSITNLDWECLSADQFGCDNSARNRSLKVPINFSYSMPLSPSLPFSFPLSPPSLRDEFITAFQLSHSPVAPSPSTTHSYIEQEVWHCNTPICEFRAGRWSHIGTHAVGLSPSFTRI